ncbi:DUF1295 domain-containing protein [Candidatus Bathyarchaeota archaeon]|nr:DUF1295 domain-containing protein [Candidatus Bathyarchaeota archaeon]
MKSTEFFIAVALSILFTVALLYATLSIPTVIHQLLLRIFPDYWWPPLEIEEALKPLGYIMFTATLVLILAGFLTQRLKLSTLGSIVSYLPTFGYFASTMFFLAGIGVLRLLWLPLLDLSPPILRLGDIVYLPYFALALLLLPVAWIFHVPVMDLNILLSLIIMALGLAIFLIGMFTWLYGKFRGFQIIDFWVYRYSRHPQYLGFLLWSYGLTLLASFFGASKGGYIPPPSLPWLTMALIIVGVALHEEMVMIKKHNNEYMKYRDKTPFMLPVPKHFSNLITAPVRKLLKKERTENGKEIASIIFLYGITLVLLSIPSILFFPI